MLLPWLSFLAFAINFTNSSKILGIFFFPSISHQCVFQPIWEELSLRGHQVTVLSPNPLKNPKLTNLTEIDLGFTYDILKKQSLDEGMKKNKFLIEVLLFVSDIMKTILSSEMESKEVQQLLNDGEKFDLILVEAISPVLYGASHKFKAPVVGKHYKQFICDLLISLRFILQTLASLFYSSFYRNLT